MQYRFELRRMGEVIKEYETNSRKEARETAKEWMQTTREAVLILFVDGKEVRLKDTRKALGIRGKDFDSLKRYSIKPVETLHVYRRAGTGQGGRIGRKAFEYSEDNR